MKVAIFGATGGTGQQLVAQALEAGYTVQALVRDPARLTHTNPDLTLVTGDVLDANAVSATIQGADAVVVTLGNTANNPDWIVSDGTRVVVEAMKQQEVRRLVVVSSLGVGDSRSQVPFAFRMLMTTVLKKPMEDKERQEELVRESGLDWIMVRPGGLTDGPKTGAYKAGADGKIGVGQVSRADVADFVLKQLSDATYLYQAPAVA